MDGESLRHEIDLCKQRTKETQNSRLGLADVRLGLWRALVRLFAHARTRHALLLLGVGCLLRYKRECSIYSCVSLRMQLVHSIQHQYRTLSTPHLRTAQEG